MANREGRTSSCLSLSILIHSAAVFAVVMAADTTVIPIHEGSDVVEFSVGDPVLGTPTPENTIPQDIEVEEIVPTPTKNADLSAEEVIIVPKPKAKPKKKVAKKAKPKAKPKAMPKKEKVAEAPKLKELRPVEVVQEESPVIAKKEENVEPEKLKTEEVTPAPLPVAKKSEPKKTEPKLTDPKPAEKEIKEEVAAIEEDLTEETVAAPPITQTEPTPDPEPQAEPVEDFEKDIEEEILAAERSALEEQQQENKQAAAPANLAPHTFQQAKPAPTQQGQPGRPGLPNGFRDASSLSQIPGNPRPVYPVESQMKKEDGIVVLDFYVTQSGKVKSLRIAQSSGHQRLDREAAAKVAKWKFVPGQEGWARKPVNFKLVGPAKPMPSQLRRRAGNLSPRNSPLRTR